MKIAICLIGNYSQIWEYNNFPPQAQIFGASTSPFPHSFNATCTVVRDMPQRLYNIHPSRKNTQYLHELKKECLHLLPPGIKWDITIILQFRTILAALPPRGGIWDLALPPPQLDSHWLITSDQSVQMVGSLGPQLIKELSPPHRKILFNTLWPGGKVTDWDPLNYKHTPTPHKNIFFIPSVVRVSTQPLNYDTLGRRSIFTPSERFEQTLQQIRSIRTIPQGQEYETKIFLLEGSQLTISEINKLAHLCHVVFFNKDTLGDSYANRHPNKSIYEVYTIQKILPLVKAKWFFKFGGRYKLQREFDIGQFQKEKPVVNIIPPHLTWTQTQIAECVIYSWPRNYKSQYIENARKIIEKLKSTQNPNQAIESLLPQYMTQWMQQKYYHISGRDGIYGLEKSL